jgi:hypothetical protein
MRKLKTLCMGLAATMVLTVASIGVSAATPPVKTTTATAKSSVSTSVDTNKLTQQQLAEFVQGYNEIMADPQKYIPNYQNIMVKNAVITPDFNYGPDGGPGMGAVIAAGGVLQKGDIGYCVKELQNDLNESLAGPLSVDGNFGTATQNAVLGFQTEWNNANGFGRGLLSVDGIVGSGTQAAIKYIVTQLGQTFYD